MHLHAKTVSKLEESKYLKAVCKDCTIGPLDFFKLFFWQSAVTVFLIINTWERIFWYIITLILLIKIIKKDWAGIALYLLGRELASKCLLVNWKLASRHWWKCLWKIWKIACELVATNWAYSEERFSILFFCFFSVFNLYAF